MSGASSIAAGAQAGAAFGPWGAAIGGALGAVTDVAGAAMGGPTPMNMSSGTDQRSFFDGSGWTVSTGRDTRASGGDRTQTDPWGTSPVLSNMTGAGNSLAQVGTAAQGFMAGPGVLILAAGLIAVIAFKRAKG